MSVGGEPRHIPYGEGVDLMRQLLHSSPAAMAVFRRDAVIQYVNPKLEEVFGYEPGELVGQDYVVLLADHMREEARGQLHGYLQQSEPAPLSGDPSYPARRKNGEVFPIQYTVAPMPGPDDLWVVVTLYDVSELADAMAANDNLKRSYLTLARMNEVVARAEDAETLFEETCRVAVDEGEFLGAWVGLIGDDDVIRPIARAGKIDDYIESLHITIDPTQPYGRGPSATAFREGRAVYVRDFHATSSLDPWRQEGTAMGVEALVSLPLRAAGQVIAVLTMYAGSVEVFDESAAELFDRLAENVSLALDAFERERQLAEVAAQRQHLLGRLVTAEERERRRIAGDVHDESVQALAAVDLRLGMLQRKARESAPELSPALDQLSELLRGATASLRDLMFNLDTPEPDLSLVENLESAAEHVFVEGGVQWHVEADDVPIGAVQLGQALRVTKEALINVRKHAAATHVWIRAAADGAGVRFEVVDDGVGLADVPSQVGHRGLVTMRERAEVSGGWFHAESVPEGGSRVVFWLPLDGYLG